MKRRYCAVLVCLVMMLCQATAFSAQAEEPYANYMYDHSGEKKQEPQAYRPQRQIFGSDLHVGNFSAPQDCCVAEDGTIYLADTGNDRVVVLNGDLTPKKVITGFDNGGKRETLSQPTGLFVTGDNRLYIADSGSRRVIVLDEAGGLLQAIGRPSDRSLDKASDYIPTKVAVDKYGRIYVVASGVNQGIVELNKDGSFFSFFGAVTVDTSMAQVLRRMFNFTALENLFDYITTESSIPTEYSNLDIDETGFVFGTVSIIDTSGTIRDNQFIHRLNPKGTDVLRRPAVNPPVGDAAYMKDGEWIVSRLCDIAACCNGMYAVLDSSEGRVFTYSNEGRLMYVFGTIGKELGAFGKPVALDVTADGRYLVVDSKYNSLTVFTPTAYGEIITRAVSAYTTRDYQQAQACWKEALQYTSSSELVYDGVADAYFRTGDYENAMKYYRYSRNHDGYSAARKYYRNEWINTHFGLLLCVLIALVVLAAAGALLKRKRRKKHG